MGQTNLGSGILSGARVETMITQVYYGYVRYTDGIYVSLRIAVNAIYHGPLYVTVSIVSADRTAAWELARAIQTIISDIRWAIFQITPYRFSKLNGRRQADRRETVVPVY